jgi:hypothetical protein
MATLTAHIGYEATAGAFGRPSEVYHAVADQPVRVGTLTRRAGEPVCGARVKLADCPPGLFAPQVSCPGCVATLAREDITVDGAQ